MACDSIVGPVGPQGEAGPQGNTGPQGARGARGPQGVSGSSGTQGATGPQGARGLKGDQGPQGSQGPQGPQGSTGKEGPRGPTGPKGDTGSQGPSGANGTSFAVDASGLLSERTMYDAQPQGFAYLATNTGDLYIRQSSGWSAGIPFRGPIGLTGATGSTGPTGNTGSTGPTGNTGATGPAAWLPVVAWQSGQSYLVGPPASVVTYLGETYVCTTTHTSSGTFSSGSFAKVATKGDTGAQGTQGIQGVQGAAGPGSGDVLSGATHADNALVRYNGVNNKTIQTSGITVQDDNRLTGVATPTGTTDAANKQYVDTAVSGLTVSESTVRTALAAATAAIAVNSQKISGVATPTLGGDATNKTYVDNAISAAVIGVGSGDVVGPAGAVDNRITRFDGTTGKLLQSSAITIDDSGNVAGMGTLNARSLSADGTKLDAIESGAQVTNFTRVAAALAAATAAVAVNGQKITGLGTPTAGTDAATKTYVDSAASTAAAAAVTQASVRGALAGSLGAVDVASQKITGLGTPTLGTDATTKTYVDAVVTAARVLTALAAAAADVAVNNRKITGLGTPTVSTDATTKAYVDSIVTFTRVQDALTAASGSVAINGQKITGLGTPTAGTDAATKAYVDSVGGGGGGTVSESTVRTALASSAGVVAINGQRLENVANLVPTAPSSLTFSGTLSLDARTAVSRRATIMSANCALTLTNLTHGLVGSFCLQQAASGGPYNLTGITAAGFTVKMVEGLESLNVTQTASGLTLYAFEVVSTTEVVVSKSHLVDASYGAEAVAAIKANRRLTYVPKNSASQTLILTDGLDKKLTFTLGSAQTATLPNSSSVAWEVGTVIPWVQLGTGQLTWVGASGVTVNPPTGYTLKSRGQYAHGSAEYLGSNVWLLAGDLEASP